MTSDLAGGGGQAPRTGCSGLNGARTSEMTDRRREVRLDGLAVDHERADLAELARGAVDARHACDAPHECARRSVWASEGAGERLARATIFASTPAFAVCRMSSNAVRIWSVWTYVPAIIATPRRIAMAVSAERSLRWAMLRSASAIMAERPRRWSRISSIVGCSACRRCAPSARKTTRSANVAADGSWVTMTIVWPRSSTARRMQLEHLPAGDRVEVAGRLVAEDDGRARDERARHGDALLLAARHLGGRCVAAIAEPDGVDERVEPLAIGASAADAQRQGDVLLRGQDGQQVVGLEDEADLAAAQQREVAVVEAVEARAGDLDPALGRPVEAGEDVQQRRLARARRAHDRGEAAAVERDVDAAQRLDGRRCRRRSA